jgi:isochorismate synthase
VQHAIGASTDRSVFIAAVESAIEQMMKTGTDKVVLSTRTFIRATADIPMYLERLRLAYPRAFVYYFSHPQVGHWLGATPEKLLEGNASEYSTVALAGTRQKEDATIPWGQKEALEQSIVKDYIRDTLRAHGVENIRIGRAETVDYGQLQHLASEIHFTGTQAPMTYAALLHPTPAICGTPVERALGLIADLEDYKRTYYTGYVGLLNTDETKLFVNLRCMELFTDRICFYTGCGITTDSVPEDEWLETRMKLQSMVGVIEKMQKLPDIL